MSVQSVPQTPDTFMDSMCFQNKQSVHETYIFCLVRGEDLPLDIIQDGHKSKERRLLTQETPTNPMELDVCIHA